MGNLSDADGRPRKLGPGALRVLAWVLTHGSGRCLTVREVMSGLGLRAPNGVHQHLRRLRSAGLMAFEDTLERTICPACVFIPAERR